MINLTSYFLPVLNLMVQCEFHYKAGREMLSSFEIQKQSVPNEEQWCLDTTKAFAKAICALLIIY